MATATRLQPNSSHLPLRPAEVDRIGIGHILVDNCDFQAAASLIIHYAASNGPPAFVFTPNAQHVVLLNKDLRLREIYQSAALIVPDGISLIMAARLFGRSLCQRVAGVDLFERLCALSAERGLSTFLLGGRPGSADLAAAKLRALHPTLKIESYCPPMGFNNDPAELCHIAEAIKKARPSLLFVGLGAPKQEYWIAEHAVRLGATVSVGVGGSFEFIGGVVQRAPVWVRNAGCEWLYRLCLEPRRMWRRYLIGNFQFCSIIFKQALRRASLSVVLSLLRSQHFAAELHEPALKRQTLRLVDQLMRDLPVSAESASFGIAPNDEECP